jgi:hypothetical protein
MAFKNMKQPTVTNGSVDTTQGRDGYAGDYELAEAQLEYQDGNPDWQADKEGSENGEPIAYDKVGGRVPFKTTS